MAVFHSAYQNTCIPSFSCIIEIAVIEELTCHGNRLFYSIDSLKKSKIEGIRKYFFTLHFKVMP